jgi:ABC-type branched-subunit amino acid transport system ATPase component
LVTIIGPNGAGKSTLLKAMYGLLHLRGGKVTLRDNGVEHDITGLRPNRITALGVNYVPQLDNIFQNMSIKENLEMGAYLRTDVGEQFDKVLDWFSELKGRLGQRAGTLSGGQRQMLGLARATMTDPKVLLLDEPSAGLAPRVVDEVFERIKRLNEAGISIVIVEQNAKRSLSMSDYGYVLDMGRNRFEGRGSDLLHDEKVVDLYLGGRGRLIAKNLQEDFEATPDAARVKRPGRRWTAPGGRD